MSHFSHTPAVCLKLLLQRTGLVVLIFSLIGLSSSVFNVISTPIWTTLLIFNGVGLLVLIPLFWLPSKKRDYLRVSRAALPWLLCLPFGIIIGFWVHHLAHSDSLNVAIFASVKVFIAATLFSLVIAWYFYARESSFKIKEQLKQAQLDKSQHEKELILSQLQLLQSQVEPHFLFNTLANLQAVIPSDPDKALELLNLLTKLLRQSLTGSRKKLVSLKDELNFISAYLSIHKIRLGERLNYKISVNPKLDNELLIPPLLLQPWIENAIIYGIEPALEGGTINIEITGLCENNQLHKLKVIISDDGAAGRCERLSGLSIHNTKQRLLSLFDGHSALHFQELSQGGFKLEMEIPYAQ
ncbi:histidine kinase [Motilimonas cestriensis]|uniref:Histidine kinase n=1 Tax=Motilimonas cestriensis TaxID=2742685 RepID=A0ABS8W8U9_9GAMM|nr:histidine kinase [Motilimonas cestriensis]MCE2594229.1 histidine kinase [Motilimonas cestriensis]